MRKTILSILVALLVLIPFSAKASSVSLSVNCKEVIVGNNSSCTVYATPTNGITAAKGTISISGSGATRTGINKGGLSQGDLDASSFELFGDVSNSKITLFTINFSTQSVGETTVTVKLSFFSDGDYEDNNVSISASGKLTVKPQPTAAATTTTTRKTVAGQTQATMATTRETVPTTQANLLKLTSIKVGDFQVVENNGVYYVTVNPDTEVVDVQATVPDGVSITGLGQRQLGVGTNSVNLTLNNGAGGTAIISVLITRPEGGDSNTLLKELDIIDADLKFDPNTKEYTVTVPYTTKELYILAVPYSEDAKIKGDGKFVLSDKENNAYVTVSFGDKSSTTYTIHIVKKYNGLIPIIILSIGLFTALVVMCYFMYKYDLTKKALKNKDIANKATHERKLEDQGPKLNINGSSVTGIGARVVKPQSVGVAAIATNEEKKEDMVNEMPSKIVESHPTSVVGMTPPKEEEEVSNVSPQVKVVKKIVNPTTGEVRFITVTKNADE
ncbi:MAG: hypothetical protein K5666_05190 [Bacilli bacterium]|nr:hypothetical protein [Bacilli bacterium]